MVTGRPASGKSTVVDLMADFCKLRQIDCMVVDDLEVLLGLCPESVKSEKYHYENGSLIIGPEYRTEIMGQLYSVLGERWRAVERGVRVMELANPEFGQIMERYFDDKSEESVLMVIGCNQQESKKRNQKRIGSKKIPEDFLNLFDSQEQGWIEQTRGMFVESMLIDNTLSLVELEGKVETVLKKWIGE